MLEKEKPRIAITIEQGLIDWIDGQIETKRFASRSHAVEYCVTHLMVEEQQGKNAEAFPAAA